MNNGYFEYVGNLHIHSLYSDGGGDVNQIAQSAKRMGHGFIILTDHHHMTDDFHLEDEGIHNGVVVLVGAEIGRRYHHYLAFDINERIKTQDLGPQEVIDQVNKQGGFGFMAHPFEKGMPFSQKSEAYTWNDLSVTGYKGICVWNFSSRWKERVRSVFHGLFHLTFKTQMLKPPSKNTLSFWDEVCKKKRVPAIGGSDAHGAKFKWGPFRFKPLSYDYLLNSINVHILLKERLSRDVKRAKDQIYEAIKEGRLFIAHENLASAKGFKVRFVPEDGTPLTLGEEGLFQPGTLEIETPEPGRIKLLKNGILEKTWHGQRASYRVRERGVYRIEVYRRLFLFGWRPWIFSNPVYLR
jgi:hypothetical protein